MDPEPSDPEDPLHRPLPLVKMPLLREHRRATQLRRLAVVGLAVVVVVGGLVGAFVRGGGEDTAESDGESHAIAGEPSDADALAALHDDEDGDADDGADEAAEPALPSPRPADDAPTTPGAAIRHEARFGAARSFRQAVVATGLSREEATALEGALEGVLDFRRCRPTDRMYLERDDDDEMVRFEYHASVTEYVVVQRDGVGALRAERVQRPVERVRIARGGRIRSSLGEALEEAGLGRGLVGVFVEMFGGRANFNTDTRTGDSFRIIVDEERLDGQLLRYGTAYAVEYHGASTGVLRAFYFEPVRGDGDHYDETGRSMHGGWLRAPLRYDHISSRFDPRRMHPILRRIQPHNGVDYAAPTGTPVWAAAAGEVTWAGPKGPNGNLIGIRHADGYQTYYAHLHRIEPGIRRGVQVSQRQLIGQVGTTGRSTGPHLHFGLKRGAEFVDPLSAINGPGREMSSNLLGEYRRRKRVLERELAAIPLTDHLPRAQDDSAAGAL